LYDNFVMNSYNNLVYYYFVEILIFKSLLVLPFIFVFWFLNVNERSAEHTSPINIRELKHHL